jgi:triosephosphate isomerase (TIM)
MGIEWCLIGHSERRGEFGLPTPAESNELLATKLAYILAKGLKCVLCIGEAFPLGLEPRSSARAADWPSGPLFGSLCGQPLPIREKGAAAVLAYCADQLKPCIASLDPARMVIAYEPVWAIGTGVSASAAQAQETHKMLREWLASNVSPACAGAMRIQYGGSANGKNAPEVSAKVARREASERREAWHPRDYVRGC